MTNNESDKLTLDPGPSSGLALSLVQEEAPAPAAPEKKVTPATNPAAALEAFPGVHKKIQAMWATGECDQFLHSLFMDTRGGTRRGFPMEAADEIMFLVKFNKTVRAIPLMGQMNISFAEAFRVVDQADQKRLTQGVSDVWGATGAVGDAPTRATRPQAGGQRTTSARPKGKSSATGVLPWIIFLVALALAYKLLLPVFTGGGPHIGG